MSMPSSHPGTPTKVKYSHCPQCHDNATTLQTASPADGPPYLYCPNCNWKEQQQPGQGLLDVSSFIDGMTIINGVVQIPYTRWMELRATAPSGTGSFDTYRSMPYEVIDAPQAQPLGKYTITGDPCPQCREERPYTAPEVLPVVGHCHKHGAAWGCHVHDHNFQADCTTCTTAQEYNKRDEEQVRKLATDIRKQAIPLEDMPVNAFPNTIWESKKAVHDPETTWPDGRDEIAEGAASRKAGRLPPQEMIGGMAHSVGTPPYHLIPTIALVELANQYALGEKMKGKDAWNAFSSNQQVLKSKEALAARLGHVVSHALVMLQDLATDKPLNVRDAAAIAWGGTFAICATSAQKGTK